MQAIESARQTLAQERAVGPEVGESDQATGVLWRLLRLPVELQDAVIRHLPLADILVWQKVNRNFCHRVRVSCMRERAFCRAPGTAFSPVAWSRASYDRLVRAWLAGFRANPLGPGWPDRRFRPDVLCCAVLRTLKETRHLVLTRQAVFELPGVELQTPSFSPTGHYLVFRSEEDVGAMRSASASIFSWQSSGWQPGSPFAGVQGLCGICFTDDERRTAVAGKDSVAIWEKRQASWHQTAQLVGHRPFQGCTLHMLFSPDGNSLVVHNLTRGHQCIWDLDSRQQWLAGGSLFLETGPAEARPAVFSPDSRWLLIYPADGQCALQGRQAPGTWVLHRLRLRKHQLFVECALFRPHSQQLFLRLEDQSLSVWQLRQAAWSECGAVEHTAGIEAFWFSPDGRYLATAAARVGSFLWSEEASGAWRLAHTLYGRACDRHVFFPFVHFDLAGRWLLTGDSMAGSREAPWRLWVRGRQGHWHYCPQAGAGALGRASQLLASTMDGQHLLTQNLQQGRCSLRLWAFNGDDWNLRAERALPAGMPFCELAVDPFCCHLVVVTNWGSVGHPRVQFLRVQEAAASD